MIRETEDMALAALLDAGAEISNAFNVEILREVYMVQKIHQFDELRDIPLRSVQRLVEQYVDSGAVL